ncbi:MAG: hypothetical protein H6642_00205 [Caldilineaceae bacterium]|nr:hypothetical protein [Caldilineaceae bacterium]
MTDDLKTSDSSAASAAASAPGQAAPEEHYLLRISSSKYSEEDARFLRHDERGPQRSRTSERRLSIYQGPWALIIGFALLILLGGILLKLPWSAAPGQEIGWSEALFTSTSAITVTGLAVLTTGTDFSFFGQIVILLLLQIGGVGFIAFSVLLFRLIGRSVTLQTRLIVQQSLGTQRASGVLRLALYVLGVTLTVEAIGAFLLWLRWRTTLPNDQAIWYAIFHAISSYCNAGFDLFSGTSHATLFGYGTDWYTLLVMAGLILIGSFGITVLYDLASFPRDRILGLNTRFTLLMTLILTVVGVFIMLLDPILHGLIFAGVPFFDRLAATFFTIVSARTAGLTILPIAQLSEATQLIIMLWMFIGGAPASMAGGVSSSTVAVLLTAVIATARGLDESVAFRRAIPAETIFKAMAIMTVSTLLVAGVTLLLALRQEGPVFQVAFEVVSAFANAGYSLDFTGELDNFGRFLIAFTMYWGRLGPLTIVVALAERSRPNFIRYPEEPIILG